MTVGSDLRRELRKSLRQKDRARLAELRAAIARAHGERKTRVHEVRGLVRVELVRAREKLRTLRLSLREAQKAARAVARFVPAGVRAKGAAQIASAARAGARAEQAARGELVEERRTQREVRRAEQKQPQLSTARERASESDDEVRGNLPPELVPVFDRVKRGIHAGPRISRTEQFLQWAHDNSAAVERIQNEQHAKDVEALEREERELAREIASGARYRGHAAELAHALEPSAKPAGVRKPYERPAVTSSRPATPRELAAKRAKVRGGKPAKVVRSRAAPPKGRKRAAVPF